MLKQLCILPEISNHSSMILTVLPIAHRKKPFRFSNFWMVHGGFKNMLCNSRQHPVKGSLMQGLSQKLKRFQLVFKDLNLKVYSNIGATKENARIELQGI